MYVYEQPHISCSQFCNCFERPTRSRARLRLEQVVEWRASRDVELQFAALVDGFREVVPLEWLRAFDERELEVRPPLLIHVRLLYCTVLYNYSAILSKRENRITCTYSVILCVISEH